MMSLLQINKIIEPVEKLTQLKIVISPPELPTLQKEMAGEPTNATYVIQAYVTRGLSSLGHQLSFIGSHSINKVVFTNDIEKFAPAPRTWSKSWLFEFSERVSWFVQRSLRVPYLNVFSNLRLYDACLRCLPGNDLVYERHGLYKFGVAMACRRLRLPYVLYFEADDIMEYDVMNRPIKGLRRWRAKDAMRYNLKTADCIISVSEPGKNHLIDQWKISADKIVVFTNVADVDKFRPDHKNRLQTRASLGIGNQPLIIFVGNFYKWHDVATLLDAFALVLEQQPDVHMLLVGDGARRVAMEQYAAELNVDHAVHFTGLVAHTEVPQLLAAADVAVAPYPAMDSDLWLSPLKLFEYMASGLAVIASNVGQLAEVIIDGKNGLLVAPGDSSDLANGISRLINDPALRSGLGRQAREDAVNKHSWDHYLSRLERLFAAIVKGQPYENL